MEPTKKMARIAGLMYLILIISGILSLLYVPSKLFVWDDVAETVGNILANPLLFQMGIISGLICNTCFIILPLALYKLLEVVDKKGALLMVIFALVSVPISYVGMVHQMNAFSLVKKTFYNDSFPIEQLNAMVMLSLESYSNHNLIAHIFWGLWLLPFGYLVYKSGFLPRFLGVMLMLGCFGYLIDFFGYFLFDGYAKTLFATIVGIPSGIGEIGICMWLLIMGVKQREFKSV